MKTKILIFISRFKIFDERIRIYTYEFHYIKYQHKRNDNLLQYCWICTLYNDVAITHSLPCMYYFIYIRIVMSEMLWTVRYAASCNNNRTKQKIIKTRDSNHAPSAIRAVGLEEYIAV